MGFQDKFRGLKQVWLFDNRIWLTFTKTFFRGEKLHIYRYKGVDFLNDHAGGDANGARDVLTSPMYRRFLPRMERQGPINVLDLGANNGGFPLLLLTDGIELKKVVSVELNPRTFVRLHFNLMRNLHCEVVPLNAAVCGERKTLEVALGEGGVSDNIYGHNTKPESRVHKINGLTFDDIYSTYFSGEVIDLCKIDIEGAEFEVLLSPSHTNLRHCRHLIMEIHEDGGRQAAEILPELAKLGFVRQDPGADADPTVHFFINAAAGHVMSKAARA